MYTDLTTVITAEEAPHVGFGGAEKLRKEIQKCKSLTSKVCVGHRHLSSFIFRISFWQEPEQ